MGFISYFKAVVKEPSATTMAVQGLEKLSDLNTLISTLRLEPYKHGWGTVRNYLVLAGKLVECIYSERLFTSFDAWYTQFCIRYTNCVSTCSQRMSEVAAKAVGEVSM